MAAFSKHPFMVGSFSSFVFVSQTYHGKDVVIPIVALAFYRPTQWHFRDKVLMGRQLLPFKLREVSWQPKQWNTRIEKNSWFGDCTRLCSEFIYICEGPDPHRSSCLSVFWRSTVAWYLSENCNRLSLSSAKCEKKPQQGGTITSELSVASWIQNLTQDYRFLSKTPCKWFLKIYLMKHCNLDYCQEILLFYEEKPTRKKNDSTIPACDNRKLSPCWILPLGVKDFGPDLALKGKRMRHRMPQMLLRFSACQFS